MGGYSSQIQFGTDGWRGLIAKDFTFANVCKVTRAIAKYLQTTYSQHQPVLIGYDTRFLADEFAQTAAEILAESGWNVKLVDRDCPTPVIAYSAKLLNSAGALMFTASHNPAPYCGIKYIPDYAGPATPEITDAIVANLVGASDAPPGDGQPLPPAITDRISLFNPQPDYLQLLYTQIDVERIRSAKLKVKYDALYSTSRGYVDTALKHCGCQVESFHTYRDVLFGGGMPEPKAEQLGELAAAVQHDQADLGLATDGDSDRFGIVDEQGNVLTPNTILLLLARHLVRHRGKRGAIVRTVATTHLLDNLAARYDLPLIETAVGFKYVGEQMRQTQVLIGGEESGGLSIIGHIPEKDGVLADLLVAEVIAYERKPLSQIVSEVLAEVNGPLHNSRLDLHLSDDHKAQILRYYRNQTVDQLAGYRVKEVGYKDGIKLYLEDGSWVLLRPSGTEPLMRVYMETRSPEQSAQISRFMEGAIAQLDPG